MQDSLLGRWEKAHTPLHANPPSKKHGMLLHDLCIVVTCTQSDVIIARHCTQHSNPSGEFYGKKPEFTGAARQCTVMTSHLVDIITAHASCTCATPGALLDSLLLPPGNPNSPRSLECWQKVVPEKDDKTDLLTKLIWMLSRRNMSWPTVPD